MSKNQKALAKAERLIEKAANKRANQLFIEGLGLASLIESFGPGQQPIERNTGGN